MESYPKRDPHFAIRFLHAINDAEIVQRVGKGAALLVQMIALREDRLRYSEPPRFWRAELMRFLGIVSPKDFQRVRDRAVEGGLLHVQRGNKRQVTTYWVLIPDWMQHRFPNEVVDKLSTTSRSASGSQSDSISSQNGTNSVGISSQNGTDAAISSRISSLISSLISSQKGTLSIPIPIPKEKECHDSGSRDASKSSTKRKKAYTEADHQTAVWMADTLRQSNPEGKKKTASEIESWANDIRLIRDRDGKSDSEIRSLFQWANRDEFWSANILSPGKLRKQWDQLAAKRKSSGRGSSSVPSSHQNLRTV